MIAFHKMAVASRIAQLPSGQREKTRRVWDILNQIQLCWTFYPLYAAAAVCLGFVFLISPGGVNIPTLGMTPWLAGIAWAFVIYLVVFPLAKAILLRRTKGLLRELKDELAGTDGDRAGELLSEWDGGALWDAMRATRRSPLCWLW